MSSLPPLLGLASAALLGATAALPAQQAPEKIDLAVLYAGSENSPRTEDFVRFLRAHFTKVGATAYPTFDATEADPYDVVILDVQMKMSETSIGIGPRPTLPPDYARATVLVNGPGVIVGREHGTKFDWW